MPEPSHTFPPPSPDSDTAPINYPPPMGPPGRSFHDNHDSNTTYHEAYCQALMEAPVPPPVGQMPWFCVCSHCKGTQGPKGEQGGRGLPGRPGSSGRRGLTGSVGPPGFVGRQGIKGQKGDDGLKGDKGPEGRVGPKGDRGLKGDKGDRGLGGPQGDQGPKGDDGVCPDVCEAIQGLPGQQGLPGPVGGRGLPGVIGPPGSQGPKGDRGAAGAPGTPGADGPKGDVGADGECDCQDGDAGSPGEKGDKGDKGEQGEGGSQGRKGDHGEKGDLGVMGIMGPPGPCMPGVHSSFSVGLSTAFPPPNTPVIFSRVFHNVQGHYDPATGLYTAPINGTYVFSYHLTVYEWVLKVGLFHNFIPVVKNTEAAHLGTVSQQVVLHLARGDRVWLLVKDHVTNGMYTSNEASSTFSGFLLHPDTCDMFQLRQPIFPMSPAEGQYSWGILPGANSTLVPPTTTDQ
ncbi:uncharacterized protein ACJ7VT_002641 [Polymixia lowei]